MPISTLPVVAALAGSVYLAAGYLLIEKVALDG